MVYWNTYYKIQNNEKNKNIKRSCISIGQQKPHQMSVWDHELEGNFGSFKMALFRASSCDMAWGERAEASASRVLQYVLPIS